MMKGNKHMKTIIHLIYPTAKTATRNLAAVAALILIGTASRTQAQSDNFNGTVLNTSKWEVSSGIIGGSITQNDALYLTTDGFEPGGWCFTPGHVGGGVGVAMRRKLAGDFDIQIDFRDFDGAYSTATQAFIFVYQDALNQGGIKRLRTYVGDFVQSGFLVGGYDTEFGSPNVATSGTFRIVRVGNLITTYFDGVEDLSVEGFTDPVIVTMSIGGPGQPGSVVYDNFLINSGMLVEPPLSCGPACAAQVQPPINVDGTSIFNVRRGVVPVKFRLTCDGTPTCDLAPATIAVTRTAGGVIGEINESLYSSQADSGPYFRNLDCQYHYNLNSSALGVGTYRVAILINGQVVGSATFQLK
jgi:hypothetical protein